MIRYILNHSLDMDTAVTGKMNSQEKLAWSKVMLDDMVDIICSNEQFKKFLIFRNQKCAANTNIFEKVAEEMNESAAADGQKNTINYSQYQIEEVGLQMQINKFESADSKWD